MKKNNKITNTASSLIFEDKGFYIILFLCIVAIGISGYVLFFAGSSSDAPSEIFTPTVDSYISSVKNDKVSPNIQDVMDKKPLKVPAKAETKVPAKTQTLKEKPKSENIAPKAPVFTSPVSGGVIKTFSITDLGYDETMGDWRVHTGTDFSANPGDRIYAVCDATVEDVYEDELKGNCVVLTNKDDVKFIYTGLNEKINVKKDEKVKSGDVLGSLSDPIEIEYAQGPHLHMECVKDGTFVNVLSVIGQK